MGVNGRCSDSDSEGHDIAAGQVPVREQAPIEHLRGGRTALCTGIVTTPNKGVSLSACKSFLVRLK